jgi:hypothetical protein
MYLTSREAKGAPRLSGLGLEWSDVMNVLTPVVSTVGQAVVAKQKADAAAKAAKVQAAADDAAKKAAATKAAAIALGPGGATASTKPQSIWSNQWTWVAAGGGLLALGGLIYLMARRRS